MSFWVVRPGGPGRGPARRPRPVHAEQHIAVALIVIDVFISSRGIPSKRVRSSPSGGRARRPATSPGRADGPGRSRSGWQVEGHRQAGLALGQVGAVQLVRGGSRRVTRVVPHHPWTVLHRIHSRPGERLTSPAGGRSGSGPAGLSSVLVEPGPGLAPVAARRSPGGAAGGRRVVGVTELGVQRIEDGELVSRPTRSSSSRGPIGNCSRPSWPRRCSSRVATLPSRSSPRCSGRGTAAHSR